MEVGSLEAIAALAGRHLPDDGRRQTAIPFLSLIRAGGRGAVNRGVLQPSFCLVIAGRKETHLAQEVIRYGAGDFLVAVIDTPSSGQIVRASRAVPYLAASIALDVAEIAAVALEMAMPAPPVLRVKTLPGAFVGRADAELRDTVHRLLRLLDAPRDAAFLAPAIRREIAYRLLSGEHGALLYRNAVAGQGEQGVGRAIAWLRTHLDRPLRVEELAQASNMSVSSLHHKFKAVTNMGPLQYQKQLRLQAARQLLLTGDVDAGHAAARVGYESQSQFSREYRRLFGAPPMQDVRSLRAAE
jgi:AraC-like DNA-binding protein